MLFYHGCCCFWRFIEGLRASLAISFGIDAPKDVRSCWSVVGCAGVHGANHVLIGTVAMFVWLSYLACTFVQVSLVILVTKMWTWSVYNIIISCWRRKDIVPLSEKSTSWIRKEEIMRFWLPWLVIFSNKFVSLSSHIPGMRGEWWQDCSWSGTRMNG